MNWMRPVESFGKIAGSDLLKGTNLSRRVGKNCRDPSTNPDLWIDYYRKSISCLKRVLKLRSAITGRDLLARLSSQESEFLKSSVLFWFSTCLRVISVPLW